MQRPLRILQDLYENLEDLGKNLEYLFNKDPQNSTLRIFMQILKDLQRSMKDFHQGGAAPLPQRQHKCYQTV